MAELIRNTIKSAKAKVTKDLVQRDVVLTQAGVQEAIDELRGAVMIVYPMGLPPYDPILMELENREELEGTQVIIFHQTSRSLRPYQPVPQQRRTLTILHFRRILTSSLLTRRPSGSVARKWSRPRPSATTSARTKSPK